MVRELRKGLEDGAITLEREDTGEEKRLIPRLDPHRRELHDIEFESHEVPLELGRGATFLLAVCVLLICGGLWWLLERIP